ncbi:hypothetical protein SOASR032_10600 [Pragia fontium]|uniref:NAD-dependent epimerase/dehydratase domain-containing protein n=1 Tax=Pragia fontium TaxID=82985 RepID=A0ABQ5LFV9_9GAMM|nr:NAD(P)-dependent oxidoreductase [Pragia fontium]GKX62491.1 hypothetical protein SOASR032_10600 [Pragia fontium]
MTILVTGATHGLGRNAVEYLQQHNTPVIATGRDIEQGEKLRQLDVPFVQADLSMITPEQEDALFDGVDTVWHCAAKSSPWGDYTDFFSANVTATRLLATMAGERKVKRFVHISTPSIYFNYRHFRDIPETFKSAKLVNHYAVTKLLAEREIQRLVLQYPDTRFIILRPRALFGPQDRVLLPRILSLLKKRRGVLPLPRGGEALMDMTYVMNVVHAMELATHVEPLPSGAVYNITNQQPVMLKQAVGQLLDMLNMQYRIKSVPYWLLSRVAGLMERYSGYSHREPAFTRYSMGALNFDMTLDSSKAQRELGYFPRYSMEQGLTLTAQWLKENGEV